MGEIQHMRVIISKLSLRLLITGPILALVSCGGDDIAAPTSGSMRIAASTSGPSPDPDGYTITLDGTDRGTLGVSAEVTIDELSSGDHVVGLSGIAANCQVQGDNPRPATVTAGASVAVAFEVICTAAPADAGTLRIITTTTGADPDPDGYAFAVDGGSSQPIGASATATLANVAAGAHTVGLSGLAANCTLQGSNPRSVTVTAAATAEASFAITCTVASGALEITTTTTGDSPIRMATLSRWITGRPRRLVSTPR